ncbi:aminotransferase class V-fold PLP-dependent enzyme [Lactonifactor longoviformis]|uniref:Aminotransferase n=1 Tax=Lactonifactor longoviformis DSM 17459 TaxID=1122155 RepID=A0A1M4SS07_9CLOT|nr:aminotransferase class I/II-fold pyridoxal phosphate-dependent enzyme [Lactonifactor longoviformis]POP31625.1 aminotransferase class V-fold PLP-dependent enzyme [Lactonifactor longoviformis]SHE34976.1 aminotransferase [Lactonifactor longoviformis DSM 17459]
MSRFVTDKVKQMKPSGIRKFFDLVSEMPDAISLGVGEPDFDTPWHIREEGIRSLKAGRTFYTSNAGLKELREEICRYIKRKQGLSYDPFSEVFVTVGGSEAIDIAFRTILEPGDEVIIPEPAFVSYVPCVQLADGVPVTISLKEENQFRLKPEELEAAITPKTKALLLSFPNNPTGAIMEKEDLEALVPLIMKHDLAVISDEIYSELTYRDPHVSIAGLPGMRERTILINGFSKAYAMTGWRLGYALAPGEIMKQMIKLHQFAIMSAPTNSQYAAVRALRYGDEDVLLMRQSYNERRRYLMHRLAQMNIPCFEPYGAFYIFPNISRFGMTSEEFANRLLSEEKVAVIPGTAFGECGEGFIRISYAYSIEELKTAFDKIESFISRLA